MPPATIINLNGNNPETNISGSTPGSMHDMLDEWIHTTETYLHAVKVLKHQLPKTANLVETSTKELSDRFVHLAESAKCQSEKMAEIISLTKSLELGNERITLEDFTQLFSDTLNNSIDKILFVSKRAITMVYMLDEALKSLTTIETFIADIQKINKQANLLALNATIESVRAGEAGLGFAVVADEVKQVSRQINALSTQMRERIITVSTSVKAGYDVLKDVATTDMSDNMLAKEKLDLLLASLIKQNNNFSEVVHASAEATQEISKNISNMVVGMQFQDRTSQYVDNSVSLLEHMESSLRSLIRKSTEIEGKIQSITTGDELAKDIEMNFKLSEFAQMFVHSIEGKPLEDIKPNGTTKSGTSANDDVELF